MYDLFSKKSSCYAIRNVELHVSATLKRQLIKDS